MEGVESKTHLFGQDGQISPEIPICIAENVERFQQCINEILTLIEQDANFSQMTAELKANVTKLSRMHGFLADQHVSLIKNHHLFHSSDSNSPRITQMFTPDQMSNTHKFRTPFGFDVISRIEGSESSFSLSSDSDSESFMSINKLLISPVNDESLKIKETKSREVLLKKILNLEEELVNLNEKLQNLEEENTNLKLVITDSNLKIKTMEDEISNLKNELSSKIFEQTHWLQGQLGSTQQEIALLQHQLASEKDKNLELQEEVYSYVADISIRDEQITELAAKINHYMTEISLLKSTHYADIARLKMEIREKCVSVDYLNNKIDGLMLEKDGVKAEKCHQANLIEELESRLNSLQFEHVRVVSSSDNAQKVTNELSLKVVELEEEVVRQKEVILDRAEEKREAIRQLSFALEHYMSRYKQLCKAFVCNKRRAVFT